MQFLQETSAISPSQRTMNSLSETEPAQVNDLHSFVYDEDTCSETDVLQNPFRVANTQGHTPISKAAYSGHRRVCEYLLGIQALVDSNPNAAIESPNTQQGSQSQVADTDVARLRVPLEDLLLADGNGFRPADIGRCAGFEKLGEWLDHLTHGLEPVAASKEEVEVV